MEIKFRMTQFRVVGMDITSDSRYCFFDTAALGHICFFISEAAKPPFGDIICPLLFQSTDNYSCIMCIINFTAYNEATVQTFALLLVPDHLYGDYQ